MEYVPHHLVADQLHMKINSLTTKDGFQVPMGRFTVLVGPNNVGKSQTLRDVHLRIAVGREARTILVRDVDVEKPATLEEAIRGLEVVDDPNMFGSSIVRGIAANLLSAEQIQFHREMLRNQLEASNGGSFLFGSLGKFRVAFLDAASRLSVASASEAYNPHASPPGRLLQGLFAAGDSMENRLREAFQNTFGMDIRLDYSGMTRLVLRVAREFAAIPSDPRLAYPVMAQYGELDVQGDGFRSFVGVVLSLLLSEGRIILLDEPEAFLHPAQARRLGYWVAQFARRGSQVIVATHNGNFLGGILAAETEVDIYRLNRERDVTTYNRVAAADITELTRSPLLSSQSILDAVFHRGVVVCEADADRAVYQTVALREHGTQNVLFVHSQGKQTVKDVVALLKAATIPACSVVDIDILNSAADLRALAAALDPAADPTKIAELRDRIAAEIEGKSDTQLLDDIRAGIAELFEQLERGDHTVAGARSALRRLDAAASKWSDIKKQGLDALDGELRDAAEELLAAAGQIGMFIVPVGELEGWIDVGTTRKKRWVRRALEELAVGECPRPLAEFVRKLLEFVGEEIRGGAAGAASTRGPSADGGPLAPAVPG